MRYGAEYRERGGQQGYETRHVAGAVYVKSIMAFTESETDTKKAALEASLSFALNPIPVSEVSRIRLMRPFLSLG
jgi:hypothetical protein